jgi:hypothetical protein
MILHTYDRRVNKWYEVEVKTNENFFRVNRGVVYFKGLIYMIGRSKADVPLSSVSSFDPVTREWPQKSYMIDPRSHIACVVLGDHIYACGGCTRRYGTRYPERYDPLTNQWYCLPDMNFVRIDASAAALNGKLYVVGGTDGRDFFSSVEYYCLFL